MSPPDLHVHLLVPSADWSSVLVRDDDGRLPEFGPVSVDNRTALVAVQRLLDDQLALAVPILETHLPPDPRAAAGDPRTVLAVCDAPPAGWKAPAGLSFRPLADAAPQVPETIGARLEMWLSEWRREGVVPALRPRWSRPGWHVRAVEWINAASRAAGRPVAGPVEVKRLWTLSALMHAPTADGGGVWSKAVFPRFAHEPAVTRLLAEAVPDAVPTVRDVKPDEG